MNWKEINELRRNCLETLSAQDRSWSLSDTRYVAFFINMAGEPCLRVEIKPEKRVADLEEAKKGGQIGSLLRHSYRDYSCSPGDMSSVELLTLGKIKGGIDRYVRGEIEQLPDGDYKRPAFEDLPQMNHGIAADSALSEMKYMAQHTQAAQA